MIPLTIHQLSVVYPTRAGEVPALRNISLAVEAGSFVALVGPSGCGKTTLLRAIGGLIHPTEGHIQLGSLSPNQARQQRIVSFLFQQPVLLPWKTICQNVELPLRLFGRSPSQAREAAHNTLNLVGLGKYASLYPHQLSGGMQQRTALARALSFSPSLFLMDEPFGALDEITRERLNIELLRLWATTRATVLFVTHSLSEAVFLADRVLLLSEHPGTIVYDTAINLPRPRKAETFEHEAFVRCVADLRAKLAQTMHEPTAT